MPRVRRVVAGWPPDAPYPADEVRRELAEADELDRARKVLTARPPVEVAAALEVLAEHRDPGDLPALLDGAVLSGAADAGGAAIRGTRPRSRGWTSWHRRCLDVAPPPRDHIV